MFRISKLAREFGLSRSTLLYYDHIGLLTPSGRSEAGYRLYSPHDRDRLAAICSFRQTGLSMEDIRRVLAREDAAGAVLQRRMRELGEEIRILQTQQHLLGLEDAPGPVAGRAAGDGGQAGLGRDASCRRDG